MANLRSLYVMFRFRFAIAVAIVASFACNAAAQPAGQAASAAGAVAAYGRELAFRPRDGVEVLAAELVRKAKPGAASLVALTGASDLVAGYSFGTTAPYMAFVVSRTAEGEPRWSEAAWLALFERLLSGSSSAGSAVGGVAGTIYMFIVDDDARGASPRPGDPLIRNPRLRYAVADMGVEALAVLDFGEQPAALRLRAASWKRLAPRRVVEAARAAEKASGVDCPQTPIADFYAAAGMSAGAAALAPWLDAGVPAVALEPSGTVSSAPDAETADIASYALAFAAETLGAYARPRGEDSVSGEDVNYVRYPVPFGSITLSDADIVAALLVALAVVAVALALGWLKGGRRSAMLKAVAGEAVAAAGFSVTALYGSKLLSRAAFWAAGSVFGFSTGLRDGLGFPVAVALAVRALSALSLYYAASGFVSRTGLLRSHRRVDAARAALAWLCVDALAVTAVYPPAVPLLLVALIVATIATGTAASAAMGLVAVGVAALPFFDPRVIAAIGDASGGAGSVASAMLDAGLRGNATLAAFTAPFGLWVGVASSPASRIRRGQKTAFFWLAGAAACAAAEVVARLASGMP